ncbi:hypothetical protein [Flammeovirga sp. SJP92]|uniref:hypothetical protein n=1 Tax=Flammeovirga sp. SJP92 TaxID=1775430 RepID=UPI0007870C1B|nr:hypothetical protein [Flammeovirga sp. SJP92]KXX71304.1 hypothetical protein AVL50_06770 [Flammeovirga sp. SJP92]
MEIEIYITVILIGAIIWFVSKRYSGHLSSLMHQGFNVNKSNITKSIFYHEDDYLQVEIVPNENFKELISQAENIKYFEGSNYTEDGYKDIIVRDEKEYLLKQREIDPKNLDIIFSKLSLDRSEEISTGIIPGEFICKDTIGYGEDYNGIFFNYKTDYVTNIWVVGTPDVEKVNLIQVLNEIGVKWNLLLMDWNTLELIDLKSIEHIEKYLSENMLQQQS